MGLSAVIFAGLMLIQMIVMNLLFSDYARDYSRRFEEDRLQIVVNYAVDAAVREMSLDATSLGQDYESIAKINVEPQIAVDIFASIIVKNYDIPLTPISKQEVLTEYVPVFMIAAYDGYYMLDRFEIGSGVQNMILGPKMPYSITKDDGYYSYNLSFTSAIKIDLNGNITKVNYNEAGTQEAIVAGIISDKLNDCLGRLSHKDPKGSFYIPSKPTIVSATNAIKNTTVLAYIDNFDLYGYGENLQSFGVGGAEIRQRNVIVGFTKYTNGEYKKYYSYINQAPAESSTIVYKQTFDTQEEAAKEGYYYYVS